MNHNERVKEDSTILHIRDFFTHLGVTIDSIEVTEHPLHTIFSIQTEDTELLIGPHGETLRAINALFRGMLRTSQEEKRFLIDIDNYQKNKLDVLKEQAGSAADKVKLLGCEVELEPMNAYERMVVHALYADSAEIATHSTGEGSLRRVVLTPKRGV